MSLCELLCLAISRKHGGRCVAGFRTDGPGWIRPVGINKDGALLGWTYKFADDSEPRILDTIQVGLRGPRPLPHQPENWMVDLTRWKLISRPANPPDLMPALLPLISRNPVLLGSRDDRIPYDVLKARPATASLTLVKPEHFAWQIRSKGPGHRQTRAEFTVGGQFYCLSVTDIIWENRLCHLAPGVHRKEEGGICPTDEILLTISMGEPFGPENLCYKFIAAVIVMPRR